ncbi:MAG: glycine/D-amino acid oxidase-like deaminating enzyme [Limisphaerales bacterium]|jgi:glycine/D-amino acid oxidase-like deaminating enzyme
MPAKINPTMNKVKRSIIIVGGGLFGLSSALELRRRDWRVTLIDPGTIPRPEAASTDISKVVRADYGSDRVYTEWGLQALAGWRRWNRHWGETVYHEDGFLVLSENEPQPGSFEYESRDLLTELEQPLELLTDDWEQAHPAWATDRYHFGYLNRKGGWAASRRVIELLAKDARAAGIEIRERTPFERLIETGSQVSGVSAGGERLLADQVLMACGAWTPTLLPELSKVLWATGQPVVHFKIEDVPRFTAPKFPVWAAEIGATGWYGFPALVDGTLKIANHGPGRRVHPEEPRNILPEEEQRFLEFAETTFPALGNSPIIERRLCLYSDSFDGKFWIDHHPDRPGLVVASGDSGHAFKFGPVLGDLIADVVEQKSHLFQDRFAWRDPDQAGGENARFLGD